jgi:parallel beta-helix repeat protein
VANKFGKVIVSGLALAFAICGAGLANAGTIYVGGCAIPSYPTISLAVANSTNGGVVKVCPGGGSGPGGSYPEQVKITKNLTLEGITSGTAGEAVITAPSGGVVQNATSVDAFFNDAIAAQILVQNAAAVTITDLTVDGGTSWNGCNPNLVGIYYQNSSGTINRVVTRNQTAVPISGCQSGLGIYVESPSGTSTVTVENSSVHDFQKNGITGDEVGTTLTATLNQVRGVGPTAAIAQNGILVLDGATGKIQSNTVTDVNYTTAPESSGILVYDSANVTISANHVGSAQYGIAIEGDGSFPANDATISDNVVNGAFDGVDVCGSTGGSVTGNNIGGSTESGIHLDGSCTPTAGGTTVSGNTVNEGCAAYLDNTGESPTFTAAETTNVVNTILTGQDTCP